MGSQDLVPFWNCNVSDDEKTTECPPFLLHLSDKDRRIIGSSESAFILLDWPHVRQLVTSDRLDLFQRSPLALRRYRAFIHRLSHSYGSVTDYLLRERLRWPPPVTPRGRPFEYPRDDVKVLLNDWPYGIDPRIVHLVVWTKFQLDEDPTSGQLTDSARAGIDAFVTDTFCSRLPPDRIAWFKNWSALRSVDQIQHFHVMMFDPDPEFIRHITNGDVPQYQRRGCPKA
ncbi:N-acetylglucosamine-induced protein 1 [Ophiocordyceps camponoti-floridani]|uniref:N-acetylglucosamine-induced protein 1 n=1 Tax=Ophiocordyceps camponoti-floridani TaxID=2030778 RepID=A0A8H4QBX1_9HYPO|nr:N-acetylglucosamine-induced protein 1 [Ophiocordyceps camponoti-floridani]